MYGYILPIRRRLSPPALAQYRADYCGLCRCLGKRYGFLSRFLVSYDVTFLYGLLAAAEPEGGAARCFCPANPFCRKECRSQDASMEYCADISVLLAAGKLRDTVADSGFLKSLAARICLRMLRGKERRAETRLPMQAKAIVGQTARLAELERQNCSSMDHTADTFAVLLQSLVPEAASNGRILRQILYHTGRFLYLMDALDDLEQDVKHDRYNPLRFRYSLWNGRLTESDQKEFLLAVEASVDAMAAAFDLLPCASHGELLENIITYGMPTVMQAVSQGRFHRKRNRSKP